MAAWAAGGPASARLHGIAAGADYDNAHTAGNASSRSNYRYADRERRPSSRGAFRHDTVRTNGTTHRTRLVRRSLDEASPGCRHHGSRDTTYAARRASIRYRYASPREYGECGPASCWRGTACREKFPLRTAEAEPPDDLRAARRYAKLRRTWNLPGRRATPAQAQAKAKVSL